MEKLKDFIKKYYIPLTLISLLIISSSWLVFKGLPYQHDIEFHYTRVASIAKCIKNKDFLALIHDTFFGYGYATGLFYSNFFFYPVAILNAIGLPLMLCYKILMILINLGTILSMYYVLKKILKDKPLALIGTTIYNFSMYRLVDVFVRGSIGETLAFMVVPLIILGIYELIYGDYKKWYYFTIGFVFLLLSHLISTLLVAIFMVILIMLNYQRFIKEKARIKYLIISGVVGLFLGSFFVLPMLEQYLFASINIFKAGSIYLPQTEVLSFRELLIPLKITDYYLGPVLIGLILIRFLYKKKNVSKKDLTLLDFSDKLLVLGIIALLLTTNIFPWKTLGNSLSFIQFPWRLLLISTLFIATSSVISFYILTNQKKEKLLLKIYSIIIIFSLMLVGVYSLQYGIRKNHYNTFTIDETGTGEYLPYDTDSELLENGEVKLISNNPDLVMTYDKRGTTIDLRYSNNQKDNTYIEVPLLNYLGYKAEGATISNGNNNLIRVNLEKESGNVKIYYQGTSVQKLANVVSFISMITFIGYIIKEKRKEHELNRNFKR